MTCHGPVVQGEPEVGIHENDEGRNQYDQNEQKDRHPFLQVQGHFSHPNGPATISQFPRK